MRINRFNIALSIVIASVFVSLSYRLQGSAATSIQALYWSVPTAILLTVAAMCLFAVDDPISNASRARPNVALTALIFSFALDLYQSYPSRHAFVMIAILFFATIFVYVYYGRGRTESLVVIIAFVWSTYFCLQGNYVTIGGDLLPIVVEAGHYLLHGIDPYMADFSKVTTNSFFYLPFQWLPFLPAVALGFDPRIINAVTLLILVLIFRGWKPIFAASINRNDISLLWMALLFSQTFTRAAARTYIFPYWLMLILFVWALVNKRDLLGAILLGCLLATRQTILFDAVAVLIGLIGQVKVGRLMALGFLAVGIAAISLAPFVIHHPGFLLKVFVQGPSRSVADNTNNAIASMQVGVVPLIRNFGLSLPWFTLQIFAVLSCLIIIFLRKPKSRVEVALSMGGVDLVAALSGAQTFEYYWGSGLAVALAALFFAERAPVSKLDKGLHCTL